MIEYLREKGLFTILSVFVLAVFFALFAVYLLNPLTVTVNGIAETSVPATNATISFTLASTDSSSPQNAINSVNSKALELRNFLKIKGISENNISQSEVTAVPASLINSTSSGYQASISMALKLNKVAEAGQMVASLYGQGVLVVSQPILSIDDPSKVDSQAFNLAMKDAKKQANAIAGSNFKLFKKVVSVSQVTSPSTSTSTIKQVSLTPNLDTAGGVFKVVKAVTVTYKMW